jgi:hypothetical protein
MSLEEFNKLISLAGLPELEYFGSAVYLSAFNNAMMT